VYQYENVDDHGWGDYQNFFAACPNLKGVALGHPNDVEVGLTSYTEEQFLNCDVPNVPEGDQEIWKERILHLKSLGIKIMSFDSIFDNDNLLSELKKESNIRWCFHQL
jgi:hypothetical protein